MQFDYLIVGAGLYGAVFAHEMTKAGKKCYVIDRRDHIAGNIYTEKKNGINVHLYGAHIFHTSDKEVWNYVQEFAEFNNYINCPVARYKDELYNLPFNMNTFSKMWNIQTPAQAMEIIEKQRKEAAVENPSNLEEQALSLAGRDVYTKLIKGYTEKQWGRKCSELPAFIIKRLPVRFVHDNNYFNDRFQGIPMGGYNKLIYGMLEGVETRLDTDFFDDRQHWEQIADKILYTGKLDEYYDYRFGKLEYRTVRFEEEILDMPNFQGNAVMNFTDAEVPYTRIIEHKHFEMFGDDVYKCPKTVISREYSSEWKEGMEPYYSVNDERNMSIYQQYKDLADQEPNLILGGHLAEYKYYDMAPIMEKVMELFDN